MIEPSAVSPDPGLDESFYAARAGIKFLFDEEGAEAASSTSAGDTNSTSTGGRSPQVRSLAPVESTQDGQAESAMTTLMIRNIPRKYTQRQLLQDLQDACGIAAMLDFFYLPADLGTGRNLGYCFVNFVQASNALTVKQKLHKLRLFAGAKCGLSIGFADVQGFESNLRNVRRSLMHRIKNREYRPLIAIDGELVPVTA